MNSTAASLLFSPVPGQSCPFAPDIETSSLLESARVSYLEGQIKMQEKKLRVRLCKLDNSLIVKL